MTDPQLTGSDGPPAGLTWGIKQSFMRYLGALDDARIGLGDGASMLDMGAFSFGFEASTVDPSGETGTFDFRGTVELSAHGGMLALHLRNPRVVVSSTGAVLSIEGAPGAASERLHLCTMEDGSYESLGPDLFWSSQHVLLTQEGESAFGGQYAAGQQLDPICFRISL